MTSKSRRLTQIIQNANTKDVTFDSVTINGALTINGTTTAINSNTVTIDDPIFTLGGDTAPIIDDNKDRGIEFRWHNGITAKRGFFGFDDSTGYLTFIPDATNTAEVFSGALGDIQATNFRGALIGNADTSSKWATARTISLGGDLSGSVSIDGSANVTLTATVAANAVALGTDTTGNYVATASVSGNGLSGSAAGEGASFTVSSNATDANTASTLVFRNASGNFSAGTITAALSGNATSATTATTATNQSGGTVSATTGSFTGTITKTSADSTGIRLVGTAPTITFADTDHTSGYIHVNSNLMYVLRGASNAAEGSWSQVNGQWPFIFDLSNNNATGGGVITAISDMRAPIFYDSNNTGYYTDPTSITALRTVGDWRADSASWSGEFAGKMQYHSTHWYIQYQGTARFRNSGGGDVCTIDSSGNLVANGNVTAFSDARLKENVATIDNALEKTLKLRGVYYNKIGESDRKVGVIAQEVKEVLPEVVLNVVNTDPTTKQTTETYAVDYGNVVGLLIEAIKEQQKQIDDLKYQIAQTK